MKKYIPAGTTAWIEEDGIPGPTAGDTIVYPETILDPYVKVQLGECQEWLVVCFPNLFLHETLGMLKLSEAKNGHDCSLNSSHLLNLKFSKASSVIVSVRSNLSYMRLSARI